jgi:hypothetical protein
MGRNRGYEPDAPRKKSWGLTLAIGTVALVALVGVLVWIGATHSSSPSSEDTPLPEALKFSQPEGVSAGGNQWNNASITVAASSLTIGSITFVVYGPSSTPIQPPAGAVVSLFPNPGPPLASFDLRSQSWGSSSSGIHLIVGEKISLYWPGGPFLGGYNLVATGSNGFSGHVAMSLQ